jgi:hypothetical protein
LMTLSTVKDSKLLPFDYDWYGVNLSGYQPIK